MHALSISAYAGKAMEKTPDIIRKSLLNFLYTFLIDLEFNQIVGALVMLTIGLTLLWGCRVIPEQRRSLKPVMIGYGLNLLVYFLWMVMLFLTYILSMSVDEALRSASFDRYNGTGLTYLLGLTAILLIAWANQTNLPDAKFFRQIQLLSKSAIVLFLCGAVMAYTLPALQSTNLYNRIFARKSSDSDLREAMVSIIEEHELPLGESYIIYCKDKNAKYSPYTYPLRAATYDLLSYDIRTVIGKTTGDGPKYILRYYDGGSYAYEEADYMNDDYLAHLPDCRAVIFLNENAEFEAEVRAELERTGADVPLIFYQ